MKRSDFQRLSTVRIKESQVLLDRRLYSGAYYLAGYSVECALKACIAKKTVRYDFPDRKLAERAWVHNLEDLIGTAGLTKNLEDEMRQNPSLERYWSTVKKWKEDSRYRSVGKSEANDLFEAITGDPNGVLLWLKKFW